MVLTARLKPRTPGIIAARQGDIDTFSATQGLVGHANRVQPYPQTATGYPRDSILLGGESSLSLSLCGRAAAAPLRQGRA